MAPNSMLESSTGLPALRVINLIKGGWDLCHVGAGK